MTSEPRRNAVPVRLSNTEKEAVDIEAAHCGKSVSAYIRARVFGRRADPRPALAAAGELLTLCHTLRAMAEAGEIDVDRVRAIARKVIAIVRIEGEQ